jgi:hypothetical protein
MTRNITHKKMTAHVPRRATTMASKEGMYLHRTRYESIHWLPMTVESHAELVPLDFDGENEFYGPTKPAFRTTAP